MGEDCEREKSNKIQTEQAQTRLSQVSSHLRPTTSISTPSTAKRGRRRKADSNNLPADYNDVLSQIDTLRKLASTPDTSRSGYIRQKEAGKLWVRERVEALLDKGSLREVGGITGEVEWRLLDDGKETSNGREEPVKFTPSNSVQGFGKLNGRRIVFTADDYSLRAGHADGALIEKTEYIEKLALSLRIPIIKLVDGSSGGGSVTTIASQGFSYVPPLPGFNHAVAQLNAGIPNLGAVLGPAIGLGAARVTICHFSVMAGDIGSLFAAGPKVVEGATFEEGLSLRDLGGPDMHCRNGTIDNLASSEYDAFAQLRRVISYLPNSGASLPPVMFESNDPPNRRDESLRSIVPRKRERTYSPYAVITTVVDKHSWFEIGALWGTTTIVGLARLNGHPVGIISNNCNSGGGALDASGSQKLNRHLKLCDVMNLPVLQFVDVPGYAVGTVSERSGTMRHGVNLAATYLTTTMPVFSVLTRRAYGVAGGVMLDCRDPRMRIAWPSGDWGSLPLQGGIEVGHSAELKRATKEGGEAKAKEIYKSLEDKYTRLMNPVRTANAFSIEDIVDPADTRTIVCKWAKYVYMDLLPIRLQERMAGKIKPQFA